MAVKKGYVATQSLSMAPPTAAVQGTDGKPAPRCLSGPSLWTPPCHCATNKASSLVHPLDTPVTTRPLTLSPFLLRAGPPVTGLTAADVSIGLWCLPRAPGTT